MLLGAAAATLTAAFTAAGLLRILGLLRLQLLRWWLQRMLLGTAAFPTAFPTIASTAAAAARLRTLGLLQLQLVRWWL